MCPHHLLPSLGRARVGYLPGGRIVGIGLIVRLVEAFAHRMVLQEALGQQVADALVTHLGARAAGVVLDARHRSRGPRRATAGRAGGHPGLRGGVARRPGRARGVHRGHRGGALAVSGEGLDAVAVFPLPGVVFLPGQRLPLHIFEPRYRAMVRDALAGDGWIAVGVCRGAPAPEPVAFSRVATAGRISAHQRLADGRYNILLDGRVRVRLDELPFASPYRRARATPLRDLDEDRVASADHAAVLHLASQVVRVARARQPALDFDAQLDLPPARLALRLVDRFVIDPALRLAVLRCDDGPSLVRAATDALSGLLVESGRVEAAGARSPRGMTARSRV